MHTHQPDAVREVWRLCATGRAKVQAVTLEYEGGRWKALFRLRLLDGSTRLRNAGEPVKNHGGAVGVDLGLTHLVTLDRPIPGITDEHGHVPNPRILEHPSAASTPTRPRDREMRQGQQEPDQAHPPPREAARQGRRDQEAVPARAVTATGRRVRRHVCREPPRRRHGAAEGSPQRPERGGRVDERAGASARVQDLRPGRDARQGRPVLPQFADLLRVRGENQAPAVANGSTTAPRAASPSTGTSTPRATSAPKANASCVSNSMRTTSPRYAGRR
jgi:hypothetical protein